MDECREALSRCMSLPLAEIVSVQYRVIRFMEKHRGSLNRHKPRKFHWVTVNPRPDVSLTDFVNAVHRFAKRTTLRLIHYCFEQRGETDNTVGSGLHCHMLIIPIATQHGVSNWVRGAFGKYVGTKKAIDIRVYPVSFYEDKLQYMKGEKWDEEKGQKVFYDAIFRSRNNLDSFYTNGVEAEAGNARSSSRSSVRRQEVCESSDGSGGEESGDEVLLRV